MDFLRVTMIIVDDDLRGKDCSGKLMLCRARIKVGVEKCWHGESKGERRKERAEIPGWASYIGGCGH